MVKEIILNSAPRYRLVLHIIIIILKLCMHILLLVELIISILDYDPVIC